MDVVEAYRTVVPEAARKQAVEIFGSGRQPDWITFTSSSTVENFVRVAGAQVLTGVKVASIGPVTTASARKLGLEVAVEAGVYTSEGLVEAILRSTLATRI